MNIAAEIARTGSKASTDRITGFIGKNQNRFNSLMKALFLGPYRMTQRAANPAFICVQHYPTFIDPWMKPIIRELCSPEIPLSMKRNLLRILQFATIPPRYQGVVIDLAMGYLQDTKETIAVRVYAMTVLEHLSRQVPELKNELKVILEDHLPYGSAGFRSRGMKILNRLKALHSKTKST